MSNKNEKRQIVRGALSKRQIVRDALSKMNLTKCDKDPEKEDFVNDRDLASQLGVSKTTVWNTRQALIKQPSINPVNEDYDIVYAWRWSGDDTCAKIGVSTMGNLETRLVSTYHPTDDPVLLGVMKCRTAEEAKDNEWYFLNEALERTRPDREWVIIDEEFNRIIDEAFISDPNVLCEISRYIKTERSYNKNS